MTVPDLPSHHVRLMAYLPFVTFPPTVIALAVGIPMGGAQASPGPSTTWQTNHPRQREVNQRIGRQDQPIAGERREGELTGTQAHSLYLQEQAVRSMERAEAAFQIQRSIMVLSHARRSSS